MNGKKVKAIEIFFLNKDFKFTSIINLKQNIKLLS